MKLVRQLKTKYQPGFTLIEVAIALALSASVVAGAVYYYGNSAENSRSQRAQSLLGNIQAAVQSVYSTSPSYQDISTALIIKSGHISNADINNQGHLVNPWGGDVVIAASGALAAENHGRPGIAADLSYSITFNQVSVSGCLSLSTIQLGDTLVKLKINTNEDALLSTLDSKQQACKPGQTNSLTWTFR